jgi:hypothetical protein
VDNFFGESAESPGHSPSGENTFLKSLFFSVRFVVILSLCGSCVVLYDIEGTPGFWVPHDYRCLHVCVDRNAYDKVMCVLSKSCTSYIY